MATVEILQISKGMKKRDNASDCENFWTNDIELSWNLKNGIKTETKNSNVGAINEMFFDISSKYKVIIQK